MITVNAGSKIVFVRGVYRWRSIREAVLEVTQRRRLPADFDSWIIVGLADDQSSSITTGMPFSPPDDRLHIDGFRRKV